MDIWLDISLRMMVIKERIPGNPIKHVGILEIHIVNLFREITMKYILRPAAPADWPAIFEVAMQAVPFAEEENREWWDNRQAFDDSARTRIHVVAEDEEGEVVGYGAVEQGPEDNMYRMFVVGAPPIIQAGLGDQLYDHMLAALSTLDVWLIWVRELTMDPIVDFFRGKGFQERERFLMDNGLEAIVLYKEIRSSSPS
jgi:L-amino acid N-acyltransferase YncA